MTRRRRGSASTPTACSRTRSAFRPTRSRRCAAAESSDMRTLLLDGGTGSELRRRGMRLDAAAWSGLASLTHYDLLRAVHADYIAAGADVITTNTFATSRFVLEAAGYGEEFAAINRRAVDAAREARDSSGRDVAIAASLSCLPPNFDARAYPDGERERAAYRELTELFAEGGV